MKLSIYLGEDEIRAVLGSGGEIIKIRDACKISLKKGTLINDVITDEALVRKAFEELRNRYYTQCKNISLIMGGSQILTKVLLVPSMSSAPLRELARREMQEFILESEEDSYLYSYSIVSKGNHKNDTQTILCMAVKRQIIEEYIERFAQCKMALKTIDVALDGVNRLVQFLPPLRSKTFILVIADGRNLKTSLFINGIYAYTNRIRLVQERGQKACTAEIEQAVCSVIRFGKVRREEYTLENIYLCGLTEEECRILIPGIKEKVQIEVSVPDPGDSIQASEGIPYTMDHYLFSTGNLLKHHRSPDLISEAKRTQNRAKLLILRIAALLVLPVSIVAWSLTSYTAHRMEQRNIENQMDQIDIKTDQGEESRLNQVDELETILSSLKKQHEDHVNMNKIVAQYPQMNSTIRNRIISEGNGIVTLSNLEYSEGEVTFNGNALVYQDISDYVKRLEESSMFQTVIYNGFTDENPVDGQKDGTYYFKLSCTLKKGGKEKS